MKLSGDFAPSYITFSGTGSNVINVLEKNSSRENVKMKQLPILSEFTRRIFSKVFGENCDEIELKQFNEPKEITCKGGLMVPLSMTSDDIDSIKKVLIGTKSNVVLPDKNLKYNQLNADVESQVVSDYELFVNVFFDLNNEFNFQNKFGINPSRFNEYKDIMLKKSMEYLKSGIQEKIDDMGGNFDVNLEETMFFYPLVGALNELAFRV